MSLAAMSWAFSIVDEKLSPSAKLVLLAIADAAFEDRHFDCSVNHKTLAKKANMSIDSTQRRVAELAQLGFVHVIIQHGQKGQKIANRYIVLVDDDAKRHALAHGWATRQAGRDYEDRLYRRAVEGRLLKRTEAGSEGPLAADCGHPLAADCGHPLAADCGHPLAANETDPSRKSDEPWPHCCGHKRQTLTDSNRPPLSPPQAGGEREAALREFKKSVRQGDRSSPDGEADLPQSADDKKRLERWHKFEALWPWSNTETKHRARGGFLRLTDDEQRLALKAAPEYLETCRANRRMIAHATTWIAGKYWETAAEKKAVDQKKAAEARERLSAFERERQERQRAKYGGVFVKAHTPAGDAWRAYEIDQGVERPFNYALIEGLGFGCIRPSLWPPSSPKKPQPGDGVAATE
jgi:hypothetical protein